MTDQQKIEINKIYNGDCLEILKTFEDDFIDSCVTDPPYGINFMNKHWDYELPSVEVFKEILRVLKPGAFILCACGTRTQHRMAVNIEDAGFEIRDVITWHYGSGFPKSLDVSKAIDKTIGAEREKIKIPITPKSTAGKGTSNELDERPWLTKAREVGYNESVSNTPLTDEAKQWEGWGTALKPATEFWTMARKPLSENTVAENVLKYGTGGINIDESRIEGELEEGRERHGGGIHSDKISQLNPNAINTMPSGRFPANVIFDEFTGKILDEQTGTTKSGNNIEEKGTGGIWGASSGLPCGDQYGDEGGASRFFYCPKADNFERNKGLKYFDNQPLAASNQAKAELKRGNIDFESESDNPSSWSTISMRKNNHPTVKPIDLMRYLVKLITPKRGIVLDPFIGSGTTGIGAKMELINYIGIERELEYCKIAEARIAAWNPDKYIPQTLF
jgi:site-specific DNA-methyltransferase (adenine-specific)